MRCVFVGRRGPAWPAGEWWQVDPAWVSGGPVVARPIVVRRDAAGTVWWQEHPVTDWGALLDALGPPRPDREAVATIVFHLHGARRPVIALS